MKKNISTAVLVLMVAGTALAQNENDVLRYSQLTFGGTARSSAMGGSMGALGADFSTLSGNPAGIGVYRRSEISITPQLSFQSNTANYNGTSSEDQKMNFNLGNVGIVLTKNLERRNSEWKFVQFGLGLNRLADFQSRTTTSGVSSASLLDVYRDNAAGFTPDELMQQQRYSSNLAYQSYLLDTTSNNVNYVNPLAPGEKVTQTKTTETKGAYNETVLTLGGNYMDKLFLGFTLGLPTINYTENTVYTETTTTPGMSNFQSMTLNQYLNTTGNGVNFKFGAIYKPIESVRVGLAVHSPTWLSMHAVCPYQSPERRNLRSRCRPK